jgi:SAM-dependent methyltransferase
MSSKFGPEISDVVIDYDTETLARRPVDRQHAIAVFEKIGNQRAARIVGRIPHENGILNEQEVDKLLLRAHYELQRVSELMEHGRRISDIIQPLVKTIRDHKADGKPVRIVDIGCGPGFVVRWLAASKLLASKNVELLGVDYNAAFIHEAQRLANEEGLDCRFEVANGFKLEKPADIFISTGVLHHFRDDHLQEFFAQHRNAQAHAFAHFDFQPTPATPLGSWLFHEILMREELSRHDGVLSAIRAHHADFLMQSAVNALPDFRCAIYGARFWTLPIPRVLHSVVGMIPDLCEPFSRNLGLRSTMLDGFQP